MQINLSELSEVIARCWEAAEAATAKAIAEKHWNPKEEEITFLLRGELRAAIVEANGRSAFANAFWADLQNEFPDLSSLAADSAAALVARVNFHNRHHEGHHSGCDLGIVITQPAVYDHPGSSQVNIVRNHARALMAQAKVNTRDEFRDGHIEWGSLTDNQEDFLPKHRDYSALLLYQVGGVTRSDLTPFKWQLCRDHDLAEIKTWLLSGTLPHEMTSTEVIRGLSTGQVGTDSESVIKDIIDPRSSLPSIIEIKVDWPDGAGPPEWVPREVIKQGEQQHVVQYLT